MAAGDVGLAIDARPMLEHTVSGMALAARGSRALGRPVTAGQVFDAAASDPELDAMVGTLIDDLSPHLVNLVIAVDPARVAVGGGMVRSWGRLRGPLERALDTGVPFPPELVLATYPFDAPLVGALALGAEAAGASLGRPGLFSRKINPKQGDHYEKRLVPNLVGGPVGARHGPDRSLDLGQRQRAQLIVGVRNADHLQRVGELWPCSFNPYNPAVWGESVGFVYEPLVFVNSLESGKTTPWLASAYAWSDGNKVLTFTMRKGVKFSDGTPMTAADVVFTFDLLKANPALDLNAVWSVLKSVAQTR